MTAGRHRNVAPRHALAGSPRLADRCRRGSKLRRDAVGIPEELEVHGVAQLPISSEPVKAVALERVDPATGQRRALVDRRRGTFARWMIGPWLDTSAARV